MSLSKVEFSIQAYRPENDHGRMQGEGDFLQAKEGNCRRNQAFWHFDLALLASRVFGK